MVERALKSDFLVVGGGLMGMLTAYELAHAGHRVTLVERNELGREASWAGGGILSPLYAWRYPKAVNDLALWSQSVYPGLLRRLYEETEIDPQYQLSGLMVLDQDQLTLGAQWARAGGVRHEVMSRYWVEQVEPNLSPGHEALSFPHVGQVRNPRLLAALKQALKLHKIEVREHAPVLEIKVEGGRVVGVVVECGELIPAQQVIVTAGAWSACLLGELDSAAPTIRPVRGQMLLYEAPAGLLSHIVLSAGRYLIPRRDGRILVGSTMEYVGFDKAVTAEARQILMEYASSLLPALEKLAPAFHWAGLRPGSDNGIPLIGPHPTVDGLWLNAGHFRNGVVMAPASVRLLLDQIFKRNPILSPEPYKLL